jgi:SAM-dependent methyltransferase
MTHEDMVARWIAPLRQRRAGPGGARDFGVEIGPFRTPIPGIRPWYVDRYREYANERCLGDYWGDVAQLPFLDDLLDYVATSHVLEHAANPVAAIFEWMRVVAHGGILYLVVPDRRFAYESRRPLTDPAHMMADFENRVDNTDGTHLAEYVELSDWARMIPSASGAELERIRTDTARAYSAAVENHLEINIHFHVFERSNLVGLVDLINRRRGRPGSLEVVDAAERFPASRGDGVLLVLRVHKRPAARIRAALLRRRLGGDSAATLAPDARPLFEPTA